MEHATTTDTDALLADVDALIEQAAATDARVDALLDSWTPWSNERTRHRWPPYGPRTALYAATRLSGRPRLTDASQAHLSGLIAGADRSADPVTRRL